MFTEMMPEGAELPELVKAKSRLINNSILQSLVQ